MDWFLYGRDLRHEQVKSITQHTHRRVTTIFVSGVLRFFFSNKYLQEKTWYGKDNKNITKTTKIIFK